MNENFSPEQFNNKKVDKKTVEDSLATKGCKGCEVIEKAFGALKRFKQNI